MGFPDPGEYAVARGFLFLKVPNIDIQPLKPKIARRIDEKTFLVRGLPWQRFWIYLKTKEEGDNLLQRLTAVGAQER